MRANRVIAAMAVVSCLLTGCKDEVKSVISHPTDPEKVPTMVSRDVKTIISDDGHTRYRINTPLWLMFTEAKEPHWIFPKGVKAEELDSAFKAKTSIECDSAYYDQNKALWDLHGNVTINNASGDLIQTDQLFWDQNEHKLYSDAFIHIEKAERVIEGYGYESNEKLNNYHLRQVEAIFPVDESRFPH